MTKARTRISFFDILICLVAVCTSVCFLIFPSVSVSKTVYVKCENKDSYYDLSNNSIFSISSHGHKLTLEIKDEAVRIKESSCPDKLCEASGWSTDSTKPIVCAPAKVVIRIQSDGGTSNADIIAGR